MTQLWGHARQLSYPAIEIYALLNKPICGTIFLRISRLIELKLHIDFVPQKVSSSRIHIFKMCF